MEIDFYKIRKTSKGQRDAFECLACSIFHKKFDNVGEYQCYRGDGGDGGVEAVFIRPDQTEIGIQAKFWESCAFNSAQMGQLKDSLKAAMKNHPNLKEYYVAIPFDLTGNVAEGARGTSQTYKFDKWKNTCEGQYHIKIISWSKSVLSDVLLEVDSSGGLRKYWLDSNILTEEHYIRFIENAIAQAGKKYTPDLSIHLPLQRTLDSFSKFGVVAQQCEEKISSIKKDFINDAYFKEALGNDYEDIRNSLNSLIDSLSQLKNKKGVDKNRRELISICNGQLSLAEKHEQIQLKELQSNFGDNFADTEGFRQFQAQYMCEFPAAKLDKIRAYRAFIGAFLKWINSDTFKVAFDTFLIIKGPAGIGKTHSVVDYVKQDKSGAHYIFFGQDFNEGEPWTIFLQKLGLPGTVSKDELLGALDARAEYLNCTSILFIDALNESINCKNWKRWLNPLINDLKCYVHLKLCVTCRDTFVNDVFDDVSKYIVVEHNGFAGQEQLAIRSFFEYYRLKEPVYPLLSQEFGNPLFLHLFCQSFPRGAFAEFPKGKVGLKMIFQRYIHEKNDVISESCNIDPERKCVGLYLMDLAENMSLSKRKYVSREEAKNLAKKYHDTIEFSKTLFFQMERQGLLSFYSNGTDDFGEKLNCVRFTYERMADYFVAKKMLCNDPDLKKALQDDEWLENNKGILEMLAILLPEEKHRELADYFSPGRESIWADAFTAGLPWRSNGSISPETKQIVKNLLSQPLFAENVFLSCLNLVFIPDNPLNVNFWEETFFYSREMCDRDPVFAYVFRQGYEDRKSVYKLIDLALYQELDIYDNKALYLWAKILCWFCANPDRRIRDKSSKALVRIMLADFRIAFNLLSDFENVDDDYISERIFESIYAAILLLKRKDKCVEMANCIIGKGLLKKYENVIIHDCCRLIIELANSCEPSFIERAEYEQLLNLWPEKTFEKVDETVYRSLILKQEFSSKNINFVSHWYTDFQRYVLVDKIENFDLASKGLCLDDVYKWFVVKLHELGYPGNESKDWLYDTQTLGEYGFDRMRAVYAERLSKKYYWILLHRLVGLLQKTVPLKKESWDASPEPAEPRLHSLNFRQIDLTDVRYFVKNKYPEINVETPIINYDENNDSWIKNQGHFFDADKILDGIKDGDDKGWLPLRLYVDSKVRDRENDYSFRDSCILVAAYLTTKEYALKLTETDFKYFVSGNPFQDDSNEYQLYLGEYPVARSYYEKVERGDILENDSDHRELIKTSFKFLRGREWEYDCSNDGMDEEKELKLQEPFIFPSKELILRLNLCWDKECGWKTQNGELAVLENEKGLFISKNALNDVLGEDKRLLINIYREMVYSEGSKSQIKDIRCAYVKDKILCNCVYEKRE